MNVARLQVLLAALCFATTGTAQALGPSGIAPVDVGAARIVVGGTLLVLVARFVPDRGARRAWRVPVVALAATGVAAYQLCFFAAVADTGVAVGTIVALGSAPALTGALEWIVTGNRPPARWAVATALACAGVALLVIAGGGDAHAGVSPAGIALAIGAGASYATYTLAAKRLLADGHAPEHVMARAFGAGALLLVPVLLAGAPAALIAPGGIALALFLGIVPTALAYVLLARGLRSLTAAETSTLTLAEPLTAGLLGAIVLGEHLTAVSALGSGLVLAGLAVLAATAAARPAATLAVEPEPA
jgi:drug/metabolite transporter, DME family